MTHTLPVLSAADSLQDDAAMQPLYRGFDGGGLVPLWTEIGDLMPVHPSPAARPPMWRWRVALPSGLFAARERPAALGPPPCRATLSDAGGMYLCAG